MASPLAFVRRNWRTLVALGSVGTDAVVLLLSCGIALKAAWPEAAYIPLVIEHSSIVLLLLVVFIGFFTALGVYRTASQSSFYRQAYLAGKAFVYGIAVSLIIVLLFRVDDIPRRFLLLFLVVYPPAYMGGWFLIRLLLRWLRSRGFGRFSTLAIGSNPYLESLLNRLRRFPDLGYDVVSVVTTPFSENGDGQLHVERNTVERLVQEKGIELITFSTSQLNGSFDQLEDLCARRRIGMRVISPESDLLFSRAGLHDIAGISVYSPTHRRLEFIKRSFKRAFDVVGSLTCIILLLPVFLAVAIATKLESPGPVFFKQRRSLADNDPPFDFIKFRSMYHGADEAKQDLFHKNESSGALFKMRDDPRITRVGRFIRRYSIDELPQLFNVLKGDMSLVGPRPLPVHDYKRMNEEDHLGGYYYQRTRTKPGMTGLWQISGRSDIGFREMVLLDLYYIENQSILFDLEILAQTVPVVLFGKGAY